jgi:hypothetical protein
MSNVFLDFTKSMFNSETLQEDKELSKKLFEATSRIVALAKIADHEDGEDEASTGVDEMKISSTEKRRSTEREIHKTSGDSDTVPEAKPENGLEDLETLELLDQQIVPSPASSRVLDATQPPYPLATDALGPYSIFGNGWFDQKPNHIASISSLDASLFEGTLAMKVIESTLRLAYLALLGEEKDIAELQMQMFRFSLLYHSREELLFNLRWFLGPGRSSFPVLGHASFGFDNKDISPWYPENFNYGIGAPNILNPFIDVSAIELVNSEPTKSDLLNAVGVENYLRKIGAVYIGNNVVQVEIEAPGELPTGQRSPQTSQGTTPGLTFEGVNDILLQELGSNFTSSTFGTPEDNSLPSLNSFSVPNSLGPYEQQTPQPPIRQMVTLDVPLLLQNLAAISMCLGKGPGYLQKDVDQAIVSSILQVDS